MDTAQTEAALAEAAELRSVAGGRGRSQEQMPLVSQQQ
jgi:hypothetical protein